MSEYIRPPYSEENRNEMRGGRSGHGRLYTQAVLLARKGYYAEATQRLGRALENGECSDVEALDLQARIYAQQGFYLQAEACWRQAQNLEKTNPRYAAALERIQGTRRRFGNLPRLLSAAVSVILLLLLFWQVCWVNPKHRRQLELASQSQQQTEASISDLLEKNTGLEDRLKAIDRKIAGISATLPTAQQVVDYHSEIIDRIQARTVALEKTVNRQTKRLSEQQAGIQASFNKRIEPIEAAVSQNSSKLAGNETAIEKQVESLTLAVQTGTLPLNTEGDAEALRSSIQRLAYALNRLDFVINEVNRVEGLEKKR